MAQFYFMLEMCVEKKLELCCSLIIIIIFIIIISIVIVRYK